MPRSYKKRRRREQPIRTLRQAAHRDLEIVITETGIEPDALLAGQLVNEATMFADPWALAGIDAPLPAHRGDLRREYFRRRLGGEGETAAARDLLARELAPTPDERSAAGQLPWGHSNEPVSYEVALRAFLSVRRRLERPHPGRP